MENKTVYNGEQNCFTVRRKCRMKNENKKPCKMTDCIQVSYLKICHEKHFVKPCLITVWYDCYIKVVWKELFREHSGKKLHASIPYVEVANSTAVFRGAV